MRQTTISGHRSRYPIAEALWILTGIILLLAYGDALLVLALAFAIVTMTTAWWVHRKVEHRVERNDTELASVAHLRPALTSQRMTPPTTAGVLPRRLVWAERAAR
jgi:Flp pilus assembly protein TadB